MITLKRAHLPLFALSISAFVGLGLGRCANAQTFYCPQMTWGSPGNGMGQFGKPYGVALDAFANVYVTDITNNSILTFDTKGNYLTHKPPPRNIDHGVAREKILIFR